MTTTRLPKLIVLVACLLIAHGCNRSAQTTDTVSTDLPATVNRLADQYYAFVEERYPHVLYLVGVQPERHDGLQDNSPEARRADEAVADDLLQQLVLIDPTKLVGQTEWITHAYLLQALQDLVALRVCSSELWNVNHLGLVMNVNEMSGWHLDFPLIAESQPIGTPALREQSITRWSKIPGYIDQEIVNLRRGLELGYSAPKSVVRRVIDQIDGQLALEIEESPYYSPATRDGDSAFTAATREIVASQIYPALQRYRNFLENDYIERARERLSVTANPNGLRCYEASLRSYTTVNRSGKEVFELGQQTVAENKSRVIELGRDAYGLDEFSAIVNKVRSDPSDRFADQIELLEFSRAAVKRAEREMPRWVGEMPIQAVAVTPFPDQAEGTGIPPYYQPATVDRPGAYRIPLFKATEQSRGTAELTAFHETWPGHHLQMAVAQTQDDLHPITGVLWMSGPGEGWARYAEGLADEMGLYETTTGPILRLTWPARGMVVDPGIHLYGWTREQAIAYIQESGRYDGTFGDAMVDRIAISPGQLTSYDSGGLEIMALRRMAEDGLGDDFDVREYHDRVLETGSIPLVQLRSHIEAWVAQKKAAAPAQ